jgi:hypothetical protein
MYFTDDSLLPENQAPLMIVAAPYGPLWMPEDCTPEQKLPITWEEQVQAASYVTSEVRKFGWSSDHKNQLEFGVMPSSSEQSVRPGCYLGHARA